MKLGYALKEKGVLIYAGVSYSATRRQNFIVKVISKGPKETSNKKKVRNGRACIHDVAAVVKSVKL
jgi:hypothetical protein